MYLLLACLIALVWYLFAAGICPLALAICATVGGALALAEWFVLNSDYGRRNR